MAEGQPPYHDEHPMRVLFFIPTKPPPTLHDPQHWSDDMRDFLARCLVKDPKLRPDAFELLKVCKRALVRYIPHSAGVV
jgi:serine/threonine protein kinase